MKLIENRKQVFVGAFKLLIERLQLFIDDLQLPVGPAQFLGAFADFRFQAVAGFGQLPVGPGQRQPFRRRPDRKLITGFICAPQPFGQLPGALQPLLKPGRSLQAE